jgi:hypothetical protein
MRIRYTSSKASCCNDPGTAAGMIEDFRSKHHEAPNLYFDFAFNIRVYKNGMSFICQYKFDSLGKADVAMFCQELVEIMKTAAQAPGTTVRKLQEIRPGALA